MHREGDEACEERENGRGWGGPGDWPGRSRRREEGRDEEKEVDHLEQTAQLWESAFFQALQETRVEFLKSKIKASWGKNFDAMAKVVVDSMYKEWKEFQEAEAAEKAVEAGIKKGKPSAREGLKEALKKGLKKGPQ